MADGPTQASRAGIPPNVLAGVLDVGRRAGVDVGPWLSGTGLDPVLLYAPGTRVSFDQARLILHRALAALPGRAVGIEVGERDAQLTFGLLGVAMRASATVGEAFRLADTLHQAEGSLLDVEREHLGDEVAARSASAGPTPASWGRSPAASHGYASGSTRPGPGDRPADPGRPRRF